MAFVIPGANAAPPGDEAVAVWLKALQAEIEGKAQPSDDVRLQGADDAKRAMRRIASELFAISTRFPDESSTLLLWAMTLTERRALFDQWVDRSARSEQATLDTLRDFNERTNDWLNRTTGVDDALEAVPALFRPIRNAAGSADDFDQVRAWLDPKDFRGDDPDEQMIHGLVESPKALSSRIQSDELPDALRQDLAEVLGFLDAGRDYPELRGLIREYQRQVAIMLAAADVVRRAGWLEPGRKASLLQRINEYASAFKHRDSRRDAMSQIEALLPLSRLIGLVDSLADEPEVAEAVSPVAEEAIEKPEPVRTARLTSLVTALLKARDLTASPSHLPNEFRDAERAIRKSYSESEMAVIHALPSLVLNEAWKADPAMSSLLEVHQQHLADLELVREAPAMVTLIGRIDPKSEADFNSLVRRACNGLTRPVTRHTSHAWLNRFRHEAAQFATDLAVRHHTPQLIELCGGLHKELDQLNAEWLGRWAEAWSFNKLGDEATSLALLNRLDGALEVGLFLTSNPRALSELNRWGAWQMPDGGDARTDGFTAACQLAVATAVRDGPLAARPLLDRMDEQFALLELAAEVMASGGERFGGDLDVMSVLCQVTDAPIEGAWDHEHLNALAMLSRTAFEVRQAQQAGRPELAAEFERKLNSQARVLLDTISGDQGIGSPHEARRYDPRP